MKLFQYREDVPNIKGKMKRLKNNITKIPDIKDLVEVTDELAEHEQVMILYSLALYLHEYQSYPPGMGIDEDIVERMYNFPNLYDVIEEKFSGKRHPYSLFSKEVKVAFGLCLDLSGEGFIRVENNDKHYPEGLFLRIESTPEEFSLFEEVWNIAEDKIVNYINFWEDSINGRFSLFKSTNEKLMMEKLKYNRGEIEDLLFDITDIYYDDLEDMDLYEKTELDEEYKRLYKNNIEERGYSYPYRDRSYYRDYEMLPGSLFDRYTTSRSYNYEPTKLYDRFEKIDKSEKILEFPEEISEKLWDVFQAANGKEIMFFGELDRSEEDENLFIVKSINFPPQNNSGGYVETREGEFEMWIFNEIRQGKKFPLHVHTHPDFGAFSSAVDEAQIKKFIEDNEGNPFVIQLIISNPRKKTYFIRWFDLENNTWEKPLVKFTFNELDVEEHYPGIFNFGWRNKTSKTYDLKNNWFAKFNKLNDSLVKTQNEDLEDEEEAEDTEFEKWYMKLHKKELKIENGGESFTQESLPLDFKEKK